MRRACGALVVCVGVLFGAPAQALAACASPTRSGDLMRPLSEGQAAFSAMDGAAFQAADATAIAALRCLGEPITAQGAAAWHRHVGLSAWLVDDVAGTRAAFRSALTLQPAWRLPEEVAPPNNPLARLYDEAATLGAGPDDPIWAETGLQVLIDGGIADALPRERPVVLQLLSADGQVLETRSLAPGDALPPQVHRGPAPTPTVAIPPATETAAAERAAPRRGLLVGAGASALVAGGLYGWSAITHARYTTPGLADDAALDGLVTANHAQVWTAGGMGLLALGLGVGAVVTW